MIFSTGEIMQAAERLKQVAHRIPLEPSDTFSKMSGAKLYIKFENQQKTGSFKIRGAYNKIARRQTAVLKRRGGLFGREPCTGVAYARSSWG
jgi:threonine dehydratase